MKTLVIGLGNPLLRDDAVGLKVAQELRWRLRPDDSLEIDEDHHGGLRLMERMVGYDRAVVIDAACNGDQPGTVRTLRPDELPTRHVASAHDVGLSTALALGRKVGAALPQPENIRVVSVEADDVLNFGCNCTPAVEAAIPRAAEAVLAVLDQPGSPP